MNVVKNKFLYLIGKIENFIRKQTFITNNTLN